MLYGGDQQYGHAMGFHVTRGWSHLTTLTKCASVSDASQSNLHVHASFCVMVSCV